MSTLYIKCPACGADIHYVSGQKHAKCDYCGGDFSVPDGTPYVPEPAPEPVQHSVPESPEYPAEAPVYGRSEYRRRLRRWRRIYLIFLLIFCAVHGFGRMQEKRLGGEHGSFAVMAATVLFMFSPFAFMQTRPIPPGYADPLRYKAGRTARTVFLLVINFAAMAATSVLMNHLAD